MGEIMGFWESARDEAGKVYGAKHADRYARWEIMKRNAGTALLVFIVIAVAVRSIDVNGTAVRTVLYGALLYIGIGTAVLICTAAIGTALYRSVRRRRTVRALYRTELYNESYGTELYNRPIVRSGRTVQPYNDGTED